MARRKRARYQGPAIKREMAEVKGVIGVAEKTETCPVCGGADTENRYCLNCHGSGVVPAEEPAAARRV